MLYVNYISIKNPKQPLVVVCSVSGSMPRARGAAMKNSYVTELASNG